MGFCHCKHLTSGFPGLKTPTTPSGQRGAEAYTGVHKREPRRGSHTATVTGKLQFPTVVRSLPYPSPPIHPAVASQVYYSHTQSHRVPAQSHTRMLQPHTKSQKLHTHARACMHNTHAAAEGHRNRKPCKVPGTFTYTGARKSQRRLESK